MKLAAFNFENASSFFSQAAQPTGVPVGSVESIAGTIIRGALTGVGLIFFILMIYGGFLWMTARGNDDQVEKARNIITAGIIGVAVIVAAYAITNLITRLAVQSA